MCSFLVLRPRVQAVCREGAPLRRLQSEIGGQDQKGRERGGGEGPRRKGRAGGSVCLESHSGAEARPQFLGSGVGPVTMSSPSAGRVKHPPVPTLLWAPPTCLRPPQNIQLAARLPRGRPLGVPSSPGGGGGALGQWAERMGQKRWEGRSGQQGASRLSAGGQKRPQDRARPRLSRTQASVGDRVGRSRGAWGIPVEFSAKGHIPSLHLCPGLCQPCP